MNPTISLVTEVEVVAMDGAAAMDGATTMVGAMAVDGACHPMGIPGWLRVQLSPHCCGINEETGLMDHR